MSVKRWFLNRRTEVAPPAGKPDIAISGDTTVSLDITVSRVELLRELTAAQSVVDRKTTIAILSTFLFEAADGKLTITATDLDQSLRTSCAAEVRTPGTCTVPGHKLFDYIKLLPDGDISIKLIGNRWVKIQAARSSARMFGGPGANFPQVQAFPSECSYKISCASLNNMIAKTIFAVAKEEARYTLGGALLVLGHQSMTMVATDGHRLAHIEKLGLSLEGVSAEITTLIPRKALAELSVLLGGAEAATLEFAEDDQMLFFKIGGRVLVSRRLMGQFPNYKAILPRGNTKVVTVRSEDLMTSILCIAEFADELTSTIRLHLERNQLKLSTQSTEGSKSEDIIETPYEDDPLVAGFHASFLVDFLRATGVSGEVRLEFKDARSAMEMRSENGGEDVKYRYIVMPMNLRVGLSPTRVAAKETPTAEPEARAAARKAEMATQDALWKKRTKVATVVYWVVFFAALILWVVFCKLGWDTALTVCMWIIVPGILVAFHLFIHGPGLVFRKWLASALRRIASMLQKKR